MFLYYAGKDTIASPLFPVSIEGNPKKASNFHFRIVQSSETIICEKLFCGHALCRRNESLDNLTRTGLVNYCVINNLFAESKKMLSLIDCFHRQQIEERRNKTRSSQNQSIAEK